MQSVGISLDGGNLSAAVEAHCHHRLMVEWLAYQFNVRCDVPGSYAGRQKDDDSPALVVAELLMITAAH